MVTGCQRSQPRIEGWNISVPPSDLLGGESHWRLNQSPMVNNLILQCLIILLEQLTELRETFIYQITMFFFLCVCVLIHFNLFIWLHWVLAATRRFLFFCFVFQHVGIWFPDQGSNLRPLHWEHSLSHWTTREVPIPLFF